MGVATSHNDGIAAKEDHKKDDDSGGHIDVGNKVVEEGAGRGVGSTYCLTIG